MDNPFDIFNKRLANIEKDIAEIKAFLQLKQSTDKDIGASDEYLTKKQFCQLYNTSLSNLNNKLKSGQIKKYRLGSKVLIKKSEVEGLIKIKLHGESL